ncbi:MAG: Tfp pilus assembly protein FimT/FimU [Nitrospiria bacterium]
MNKKGFSLLEIMVAVAILTVLVGIAIPNYLTWNARYEFKDAARNLSSNLTLSKLNAMSRNNPVTLTLQANGTHTEYVTTGNVIPTETFPTDVTVAGGLPVAVTFNAFGQRTSGGAGNQIINLDSLSQTSTRYIITITASGKVSIAMQNI